MTPTGPTGPPGETGPADPTPLAGQVGAVTGGARGIGQAIATALTAEGMKVAIGDLDGQAAAASAEALGKPTLGLELDVTDKESFEQFLNEVEHQLGPLDVLVNNAGVLHLGPFLDETDEQTARQIDVNLGGVITGTRLALTRMLPRKRGHIVNVASSAGKLATPPGEATYAATKHAVVGLTESVRREHLSSGIEFSIVMPGVVATEMIAGYGAGRGVGVVQPGDVANAIVDALKRPRVDVWVPRSFAALHRLSTLLPRAGREVMLRLLKADEITWGADRTARKAYDERVGKPQ
jgi:NAD(P)-dependent dehydrogenase (short-subunit alcohol dehydrogenase family)